VYPIPAHANAQGEHPPGVLSVQFPEGVDVAVLRAADDRLLQQSSV
jgi:hypothetical protein